MVAPASLPDSATPLPSQRFPFNPLNQKEHFCSIAWSPHDPASPPQVITCHDVIARLQVIPCHDVIAPHQVITFHDAIAPHQVVTCHEVIAPANFF